MTPVDLFRPRLTIAQVAAADYHEDHRRVAALAAEMAEVGDDVRAAEFRTLAFVALRASRAEQRLIRAHEAKGKA